MSLSIKQILKILNMYIPSDEEQITNDFIKELTKQLQKERQHHETQLGKF